MARCARGTCGRSATASLGYDPVGRTVWLDDLPGDDHQVLALCTAHADNLRVPDGWTSDDVRSGSPRLWAVGPSESETITSESEVRRLARIDHERAKRQTDVEVLALFEHPGDEATPEPDEQLEFDGHVRPDEPAAEAVPEGGAVHGADEEESPDPVSGARAALIPGAVQRDVVEADESTPLLARAFRATSAG